MLLVFILEGDRFRMMVIFFYLIYIERLCVFVCVCVCVCVCVWREREKCFYLTADIRIPPRENTTMSCWEKREAMGKSGAKWEAVTAGNSLGWERRAPQESW